MLGRSKQSIRIISIFTNMQVVAIHSEIKIRKTRKEQINRKNTNSKSWKLKVQSLVIVIFKNINK